MVKNWPANAGIVGDSGSIPGSGRFKEEMATHSSIFADIIPRQTSKADYSPWGLKESDTAEPLSMQKP